MSTNLREPTSSSRIADSRRILYYRYLRGFVLVIRRFRKSRNIRDKLFENVSTWNRSNLLWYHLKNDLPVRSFFHKYSPYNREIYPKTFVLYSRFSQFLRLTIIKDHDVESGVLILNLLEWDRRHIQWLFFTIEKKNPLLFCHLIFITKRTRRFLAEIFP